MSAVTVLHLYPQELGINGDAGNVLALQRRLQWRGIPVEVVEVGIGGALPADVDIVHIGSGPRAARDRVLDDARRHDASVGSWLSTSVPVIAVGAGLQISAEAIESEDGSTQPGLGLFPVTIRDGATRTVGEVLGGVAPWGRIAGYLNHGVTLRRQTEDALVQIERGPGRSGSLPDPREGVRSGPRIGTHLHGPVLPMNPVLADELLSIALERRGETLPEADERIRAVDEQARASRVAIAHRLGAATTDV